MESTALSELRSGAFYVSCVAEFIGTFFLVLSTASALYANNNIVQISLSFGLSAASAIWMIGHVSGGHINPAVSLAMCLARKITFIRFLCYALFQMAGAFSGSLAVEVVVPAARRATLALCQPGVGVGVWAAFSCEAFATFFLVLVVLSSVDDARTDISGSTPLAIGLVIAAGHLIAIPLSGAAMNPARAFGPAAVLSYWKLHWIYWAGPMSGAALAALIYMFVFALPNPDHEADHETDHKADRNPGDSYQKLAEEGQAEQPEIQPTAQSDAK